MKKRERKDFLNIVLIKTNAHFHLKGALKGLRMKASVCNSHAWLSIYISHLLVELNQRTDCHICHVRIIPLITFIWTKFSAAQNHYKMSSSCQTILHI